jgi:hypothetical protein
MPDVFEVLGTADREAEQTMGLPSGTAVAQRAELRVDGG